MQALVKNNDTQDPDIDLDAAYWYVDSVFGSADQPNGMAALADMSPEQTRAAIRKIMSDLREDPAMLEYVLTNFVLVTQDTERLTTRDRLTGLATRARFEETLHFHLERVSRNLTTPGMLIYIDLNKFKPVNDTYGHEAGDAVLKEVAWALKNNTRIIDLPARVGGDEFVVLVMDNQKNAGMELADRLHKIFSTLSMQWKVNTIDIRASIGVAPIGRGQTMEEVYAAGDAAMYAEKAKSASARGGQPRGSDPALAPR